MTPRSLKPRQRKSPTKTQIIDLSGKVFNYFTVIKRTDNDLHNNPQWLCKCVCGTEKVVLGSSLRCNRIKSCGCKRVKDLTGQIFGKLTVVSFAGYYNDGKKKRTKWNCRCSCNNNIKSYLQTNLVQGCSKSCGCYEFKIVNKLPYYLQNWMKIPENKLYWQEKVKESIKRGIEHPLYDHSISLEERKNKRRESFEIREWRKQIYLKYNYTCQKCNIKGGKLNAHHILSYKLYPKLRLNIDNGVCLCLECHKKLHSIYGSPIENDLYMKEYLPNFQLTN